MTDAVKELDGETVKFGLLMESAQAHQKLAETHLDRLRSHTLELDGVVRDEIRRTLIEEMQMLTVETQRATDALRRVQRAANSRGLWWSLAIALLCSAVPAAFARCLLPTPTEVSALRVQRDALAGAVRQLELRGGRVEWRRCGERQRLCVRIDRESPRFGDGADYYIVKGY